MADDRIRRAAKKGFLGLSALLDPDTYADQTSTLAQRDIQYLQGEVKQPKQKQAVQPVRTQEQADLNARLLQQGYTPEEIMQMERAKAQPK